MVALMTAGDPPFPVLVSCSAWAVRAVCDDVGDDELVGVVSITDPGRASPLRAVIPSTRLLELQFRDVSVSEDEWRVRWGGDLEDLFSLGNVRALVEFAASSNKQRSHHPEGGSVVVHCGQGISRSTAVTAILAAAWGLEPHDAILEARNAHDRRRHLSLPRPWTPNRRVLKLGSHTLFGDERLLDAYDAYCSDN